MTFDEYMQSPEFRLFLDTSLYQAACDIATEVYKAAPVKKSQVYAILSVLQAERVAGLKWFADHQRKKNSKNVSDMKKSEKDKCEFWNKVAGLFDSPPQGNHSGLREAVRRELEERGFLKAQQPDSVKAEQARIKSENKRMLDEMLDRSAAIYFEHFVLHFLYRANA